MKTTVLILRNTPNSKSKDLQAKLQAQKEILFKILLLWIILEKKIQECTTDSYRLNHILQI